MQLMNTLACSEILWFREEALVHHVTFINPRYKNTFFRNKSTNERIIEHILHLLEDNFDLPSDSRCLNAKRVRLNKIKEIQAN